MDPSTQTSSSSSGLSGGAAATDLTGRKLGDFRLLRRLGQGGMGQVYVAEQASLKRKVAVKVMRTDVAGNVVSFQRFRAEAEAIARITHANIVQVYAFGEEAGLHYMALEYVEGRNLREYLERKGPPEAPLALSIMRQVANALQRASELGIIHRDIKPENILLTRRGEIKVADFGLARCFDADQPAPNLTQTGVAMGTPLYMSPEQIQGRPLDPRTDIYSFGVTCYHMLTGAPPFRGQTPLELALKHVKSEPAPLTQLRPDLPVELCFIVHKMMAKEVDNRYQTCADLLKDLALLKESLGGQKTARMSVAVSQPLPAASPTPSATVPVPAPRRTRRFALVGASIVLALAAGGAWAWVRHRNQPAPVPLPVPPAATIPRVPSEQQRYEKFLREAVEQYANPGTDRDKLEIGLRHYRDLGLFYLQNDRLDDADKFFVELTNNPHKVEAYKTLGQLGHAIVLALKNRARQSNELFLVLLGTQARDGKPPVRLPFLLSHPQLRYEISRALDYNKANATPAQPFPKRLEELRQPPKWFGPGPGKSS
jgi:serine/threonine-protein kinase